MSESPARAAAKAEKAERAARQRAEEARRRAALAERVARARAAGEAPRPDASVESVAFDFCGLSEKKRAALVGLVRDFIPESALIDLHANAPARRLDYDGASIRLRVRTRQEQFRLRACAKEPFTIAWIHEHVGETGVLYDVGANVGAYALVAACRPASTVRVVAFEPSYASVASMCENIVLNDVAARVTPLPIALSDRTTLGVLGLRDLEAGAARHVLGAAAPEGAAAVYRQPVMTFRLDDAVAQFGLPEPNHIKLDVDGGELDVLRGASRTLAAPQLRSVLVEVATDVSGAVTDVLAAHGLRLESRQAVRNKSGVEAVWYGLFLRGPA